jgi:transcription antitermination factor NusG
MFKRLFRSRAHEDSSFWNKGDLILVVSGAFEGFKGRIDQIDTQRRRVTVLIDVNGKECSVEWLSYVDVEKL